MDTLRAAGFREMDFTNHYRARYGSYGQPYSQYEFAYRFGYELAVDPSYDEEVWLVIEMHARRIWKERFPDKHWVDYRDGVRFAWQMTRNSILYG
jgi:hypothetical protein